MKNVMSFSIGALMGLVLLAGVATLLHHFDEQREETAFNDAMAHVPHYGDVVDRTFIVSEPVMTRDIHGAYYTLAISPNKEDWSMYDRSLAFMDGIAIPGECGKPPRRGDEVEMTMPLVQNWHVAGWNPTLKLYLPAGWQWNVQSICSANNAPTV